MRRPRRTTAPAVQPEIRSVRKYEFVTILLTIIGIGIALGAVVLDNTHRLDSAIAEAAADRRAGEAKMDEFRAQAAADRRASDAKMDEFLAQAAADRRTSDAKMDKFRRHMQRFDERQAPPEGPRAPAEGR